MHHASARYNRAIKNPAKVTKMASTNGSSGNGNHAPDGNGHNVPRPRVEWIARRKAENQDGNFSQMHYARKGLITEEMIYVADREKILPNWFAMK